MKNLYNSKEKSNSNFFEKTAIKKWAEGLNIHFPKKTYRWLTGTQKDAQHH